MPKIKEGKKGKIESESITFRIEKSILDELRSEADQKMESVNTLVNQIVKSYIQWHKPARKATLGYFPKVLMAKSMNYLTDEQVIQITEEYCNHHLKDITHMLRAANTFTAFMDALCSWLDSSGYHFRIDRCNGVETYVIQFDLGRKWSLFFKTQMKFVFEQFNVHDAEAKMTDNTVILEIRV
ncbi:MAG: hypothetical protein H0X50_11495 [Nitrosopumilus sp.]|nr:hypothetical protein [Nitrosopumilus sp.]